MVDTKVKIMISKHGCIHLHKKIFNKQEKEMEYELSNVNKRKDILETVT